MRSFLTLWCCVLASLSGQMAASAQAVELGGHIAINAATFTGETGNDFGYRGSFGAGLSFGIPVAGNFLLQPELRYVIKGARVDDASIEDVPVQVDARFAVSYIEVPVLMLFRFDGGSISPRLFGGIYAARKLDATIKVRPSSGGSWQSDSDDSVVDNDFGFVLGAGAELDMAGEALIFGGRATIGLSDIRDTPDAPLHNMGFELFVGMILR